MRGLWWNSTRSHWEATLPLTSDFVKVTLDSHGCCARGASHLSEKPCSPPCLFLCFALWQVRHPKIICRTETQLLLQAQYFIIYLFWKQLPEPTVCQQKPKRVLMLLQGQLFRDSRQQCWHAVKLSPWQRWQLTGSDSAALTIPRLQLNVKISCSYSLAHAHSLPWEFLNVFVLLLF